MSKGFAKDLSVIIPGRSEMWHARTVKDVLEHSKADTEVICILDETLPPNELVAGMADNVLKPLLLGRGVDAPMPIILLGALGGMVSAGLIGLFVGAVVLALGYVVFMAWVAEARWNRYSLYLPPFLPLTTMLAQPFCSPNSVSFRIRSRSLMM